MRKILPSGALRSTHSSLWLPCRVVAVQPGVGEERAFCREGELVANQVILKKHQEDFLGEELS